MKKIISLLLVLALVFSFALTLASCDNQPNGGKVETTEETTKAPETTEPEEDEETEPEEDEETESEEEIEEDTTEKSEDTKADTTTEEKTEAPVVTTEAEETTEEFFEDGEIRDLEKDEMINVRDISFLGFAGWSLQAYEDSAYLTKESIGASINVMSEVDTGIYRNMSLEIYNTVYKPIYEEMGLNVVDVTVDKTTNSNGIEVILLHQIFDIEGIEMSMDQLFVTEGNYTYVFALSMIEEADVDRVISSIDYKNSTPPATAEESGDLIVGDLSVTYPEGWFISEDEYTSIFGDGERKVVVSTEEAELFDYDDFDLNVYNDTYKPMYEMMGYIVNSVEISRINNNGLSFLVIDQELLIGDYTMLLTEYIVVVDDLAYNFSLVNFESTSEELAVIATIRVAE